MNTITVSLGRCGDRAGWETKDVREERRIVKKEEGSRGKIKRKTTMNA